MMDMLMVENLHRLAHYNPPIHTLQCYTMHALSFQVQDYSTSEGETKLATDSNDTVRDVEDATHEGNSVNYEEEYDSMDSMDSMDTISYDLNSPFRRTLIDTEHINFCRTSSGFGTPPSPQVPAPISDISGCSLSTPPDCTYVGQSLCKTPMKEPNWIKMDTTKSKRKQREHTPCKRLYAVSSQLPSTNCNGMGKRCQVRIQELYKAAISAGYNKFPCNRKKHAVKKRKKESHKRLRYQTLCRQPLTCVNCLQVCYVLHSWTKEPKKTLNNMIYSKNKSGLSDIVLSQHPYQFSVREATTNVANQNETLCESLCESLFDTTLDEELGFTSNTAQVLQCTWIDDTTEECEAVLTVILDQLDKLETTEECEVVLTNMLDHLDKLEQSENTIDIDEYDISMEGNCIVLENKHETVQQVLSNLLDIIETTM